MSLRLRDALALPLAAASLLAAAQGAWAAAAEAPTTASLAKPAEAALAALGLRLLWLSVLALVLAGALVVRRELGRWAARRAGTAAGKALRHARLLLPPFLVLAALRLLARPLGLDVWLGGDAPLRVLEFLVAINGFFLVLLPAEVLAVERALVERRGLKVPHLVRDLALGLVGGLFVAYAVNKAFDVSLMPLFATSAMLSFVLGLALQDTLSNLFAGLAVHFEGSVRLGDWIRVGEQEGEVAAITWRAIKVRTQQNTYIIVPNSTLAKSELLNFSQPTPLTRRMLPIGVAYDVPPGTVDRVVREALATIPEVRTEPPPEAMVTGFGDSAVEYDVCFWTDDPQRRVYIKNAVYSALWYHFRRAGIEIPFPMRTVTMRPERRSGSPETVRRRVAALRGVDFLTALADDDLHALARDLEEPVYASGEVVLAQDAPNDRFFLVESGRVVIEHVDAGRRTPLRLAELEPGHFFGEYSALTGDRTTAEVRAAEETRLLALPQKSLRRLLEASPATAETICSVLAARQAHRKALASAAAEEESAAAVPGDAANADAGATTAPTLLAKIRHFFRLA